MPKILAIDDKKDNLITLSALLKHSLPDCTVITAQSGTEGIERAQAELPDSILLDIKMPGMDGFEVCKRLKSDESTRHIPVIILTGVKMDTKSRVKGLELGADAFLTKPIDESELVAQLKVMLRIKKAEDLLRKEMDLLEIVVQERTKLIRESEARFRHLVENSLVGISIIKNGRFVYQNPEHVRILGPFPAPYELSNFENIYPEDVEKVKKSFRRLVSGEIHTVDIDFRLYPFGKKKGAADIRWVQCRANLIPYQDEKAILVNLMDITKAREMEKLIGIEYKMSSLGRVAAGIAHEIRNPLTGINTYLYTLEDLCDREILENKDMEMAREVIVQVKIASQKIESVVKRVMDFSRPGMPKMVLGNVNQSVEEAVNLSSVTLRKGGIRLKKLLAEDLPPSYADPQLIEHVILNLINNAAKAMVETDRAKRIEITTSARGDGIVITVSDSGPGVPPGLRRKVFEPFFTTESDGSGIGLSIVKRIITDHGGAIDVTTGKYGGAEFRIDLPVEKRLTSS